MFCSERLKILFRYSSPSGPRCLRWRLDILSGPVALEDFAYVFASPVSDSVSISAPDVDVGLPKPYLDKQSFSSNNYPA